MATRQINPRIIKAIHPITSRPHNIPNMVIRVIPIVEVMVGIVETTTVGPTDDLQVPVLAHRLAHRADEVVVLHQHNSPIFLGLRPLGHEVVDLLRKPRALRPLLLSCPSPNRPQLTQTIILFALPRTYAWKTKGQRKKKHRY